MVKTTIRKRGYFIIDFDSDPAARKWVKVTFARRGKLGKLLRKRTQRIIKNPRGTKVIRVENNKPRIGEATITYAKI